MPGEDGQTEHAYDRKTTGRPHGANGLDLNCPDFTGYQMNGDPPFYTPGLKPRRGSRKPASCRSSSRAHQTSASGAASCGIKANTALIANGSATARL